MSKIIDWLRHKLGRRQETMGNAAVPTGQLPAASNGAMSVTIQFRPPEAPQKANNGALLTEKRARIMLTSTGQTLSGQHEFLYKKEVHILKTVLQTAEDVDKLRKAVDHLAGALGVAGKSGQTGSAEDDNPRRPVPVQDLDLVERIGMSVNELNHIYLALNGGPHAGGDGSGAEAARARIQGLCRDIRQTLAMRDVNLIDDLTKFDSIRHRPIGRRCRPDGAQGDGEVNRIGMTYKANGREKVLIPALVTLYEDVNA